MKFIHIYIVLKIIIPHVCLNNGTLEPTLIPTLSPGYCYDDNRKGTRCCVGFIKSKDNRCVECPFGYFGVDCNEKCILGYYGRLCLKKCECNPTNCDIVDGCPVYYEDKETDEEENSIFSFLGKKKWIMLSITALSFVCLCIFIAVFQFFRKRWKTRLRVAELNVIQNHTSRERRLRHLSLSTEGTYRAANNMYVDNTSVTDTATIPEYVDIVDIDEKFEGVASHSRQPHAFTKFCRSERNEEDTRGNQYGDCSSTADGGYNFLSLKRNFTSDFCKKEYSFGGSLNTRCNSYKKYNPNKQTNIPLQKNVSTSKSKTLPATSGFAVKKLNTFDESTQRNNMNTFSYDLWRPQNDDSGSDCNDLENLENSTKLSETNTGIDNCIITIPDKSQDNESEFPCQMSVEQFQAENDTFFARRRNRFSRPIFNRISKLMNGLSPFNATTSSDGRMVRNKEEILPKSNNPSKNKDKPALPPRNHLKKEQKYQGVIQPHKSFNITSKLLTELKNRKKEDPRKPEKISVNSEISACNNDESSRSGQGRNKNNCEFAYELQVPIG